MRYTRAQVLLSSRSQGHQFLSLGRGDSMPVVNFIDKNRKVQCVPGANLREVAMGIRYNVYDGIHQLLNCRGNGLCGSCTIGVIEGRGMPRNETEIKRLGGMDQPWRLACQYQVLDDITVTNDPARIAAFEKARQEADQQAAEARTAPVETPLPDPAETTVEGDETAEEEAKPAASGA